MLVVNDVVNVMAAYQPVCMRAVHGSAVTECSNCRCCEIGVASRGITLHAKRRMACVGEETFTHTFVCLGNDSIVD